MTADVEIRNLTHRFGAFTALKDVNLKVGAGRFAVLLGPSGCGKTTLLSVVGGFLTPSAGSVKIGGRDVTHVRAARRPTTTVFQDYALFPHMTLGANVGFGLRMRGVSRSARDAKARELLALVGLADAFGSKPHELSGGQRQRVALARALAVDPDVLLLDEPLGALDLKLRRQMQDELKAIQRRVGTTFVHVTHDQEEAMAIADDIIVMRAGEVTDAGSPEMIYLRPGCRFSAAFMGEANFIAGRIEARDTGAVTVVTHFGRLTLPVGTLVRDDLGAGAEVTLCFRPEHLLPGRDTGSVLDLGMARIVDAAFFGTHHRCHLVTESDVRGERFVAHLPPSHRTADGECIRMRLDAARVVVLPGDGV